MASDGNDSLGKTAYLGLGSNLGDRLGNLKSALDLLSKRDGVRLEAVSDFVETEPVGGPPQGNFLNAAAKISTSLGPEELLEALQEIEHELGRVRAERWGPRIVDLDILLYDDEVVNLPHLKIPHPLMHRRRFVLEPLCRIAPEVVHPALGKSASRLLAELAFGEPPKR